MHGNWSFRFLWREWDDVLSMSCAVTACSLLLGGLGAGSRGVSGGGIRRQELGGVKKVVAGGGWGRVGARGKEVGEVPREIWGLWGLVGRLGGVKRKPRWCSLP